MPAVIDSAPSLVSRMGKVVIVEFANESDAEKLEQAFDKAKLYRDDPVEYARRYDELEGANRHALSFGGD